MYNKQPKHKANSQILLSQALQISLVRYLPISYKDSKHSFLVRRTDSHQVIHTTLLTAGIFTLAGGQVSLWQVIHLLWLIIIHLSDSGCRCDCKKTGSDKWLPNWCLSNCVRGSEILFPMYFVVFVVVLSVIDVVVVTVAYVDPNCLIYILPRLLFSPSENKNFPHHQRSCGGSKKLFAHLKFFLLLPQDLQLCKPCLCWDKRNTVLWWWWWCVCEGGLLFWQLIQK